MSESTPPTPSFFRRHFLALSASGFFLLVLVAYPALFVWQVRQHEADIEFLESRGFEVHCADPEDSLRFQAAEWILRQQPHGAAHRILSRESSNDITEIQPVWDAILRQTALKEIYVDIPANDTIMRQLGRLPLLRAVSLGFSPNVTDDWVSALPHGCTWENVHVSAPQHTQDGIIRLLRKCPKLQSVSIPADTLSDNLAGELHTVKSLETIAIVLFSDRSSDTTMRTVFRLLPSDVTVVFFGVRGTEIERPSLNLENLTGMYYYFRGLGSVEIDQAPKATEISFSVDGDCICRGVAGSIEVVSARSVDIRNCPMLTAVEFGSCDQMNRIVLSDCAKLQSLELGFPGVEPNTLELSQLPNLTVASVDRLNRSLARTLSALPSLESIEIYDFQECERGAIAELGAAPNLHRLTVIRPSADALDVLGEELCALASAPAVRILVTDGRGNGNFANTGYDMANFPREAVDRIRNLYPHWDIR